MREIRCSELPPGRTHELLVLFRRWCRRDAHDGVIAVGRNNLPGFPAQAVRRLPGLDRTHPPPELLPEHNDTAIRDSQVLQAMNRNGPLRDLGLIVAGLALARLVGLSRELAGEHDGTIRPPRRRGFWGL